MMILPHFLSQKKKMCRLEFCYMSENLKCNFSCLQFFQKIYIFCLILPNWSNQTNRGIWHISEDRAELGNFFRFFFGRIEGKKKSFWYFLTFTLYETTKFPNCNVLLRNFRCILCLSKRDARIRCACSLLAHKLKAAKRTVE